VSAWAADCVESEHLRVRDRGQPRTHLGGHFGVATRARRHFSINRPKRHRPYRRPV